MIVYLLSVLLFLITACSLMFGGFCAWVLIQRGFAAHRRGLDRLAAAEPCRVCGARFGWHEQHCGVLDRLDTGRRA